MKKIFLLIILFLGVMPCLHRGKLKITIASVVMAQNEGSEGHPPPPPPPPPPPCAGMGPTTSASLVVAGTEFDEYEVCTITFDDNCNETNTSCMLEYVSHDAPPPNGPVSGGSGGGGGDGDGDGSGDQCDPNAVGYTDSGCETATCDPNSANYNPYECAMQSCDPNSIHTDATACANQGTDQCSDPNGDPTLCENETCNPASVNYNIAECNASYCDPNSANYSAIKCAQQSTDQCSDPNGDPTLCEQETCNPNSVNYNQIECDAQNCDVTSINYSAAICADETCDPDNVNFDPTLCALQDCDATSAGYDDALCDQGTCDPTSPNYNAAQCAAMNDACTNKSQIDTYIWYYERDLDTLRNDISSTSTQEYGVSIKVTTLGPGGETIDGGTISAGSSGGDVWSYTFTDDDTDGWWIGAIHSHPNGTAPSPEDVMQLWSDYQTLVSAGASAAQLAYFQNNAFITAVTTSATYTVTIKDWSALAAFAATYNKTASDDEYRTDVGSSGSTLSDYALLHQLGSVINLYKAPVNQIASQLETLNSHNNVTINPCPDQN